MPGKKRKKVYLQYTVTTQNSTAAVKIVPTAEDIKASITVNEAPANSGSEVTATHNQNGKIVIVVTAEDTTVVKITK